MCTHACTHAHMHSEYTVASGHVHIHMHLCVRVSLLHALLISLGDNRYATGAMGGWRLLGSLCSPVLSWRYLLQRCIFVCINVYICCTECITLPTHVTGVLRGVLVWYKPTSYPLLSCALWRVFIPAPEMHLFSAQMYTFMCTISTCIYTVS